MRTFRKPPTESTSGSEIAVSRVLLNIFEHGRQRASHERNRSTDKEAICFWRGTRRPRIAERWGGSIPADSRLSTRAPETRLQLHHSFCISTSKDVIG